MIFSSRIRRYPNRMTSKTTLNHSLTLTHLPTQQHSNGDGGLSLLRASIHDIQEEDEMSKAKALRRFTFFRSRCGTNDGDKRRRDCIKDKNYSNFSLLWLSLCCCERCVAVNVVLLWAMLLFDFGRGPSPADEGFRCLPRMTMPNNSPLGYIGDVAFPTHRLRPL